MGYMYFGSHRPVVKIERHGSYDWDGNKVDRDDLIPRYRVTIEYDFSPALQGDGHVPRDGDQERDFALCVLEMIQSTVPDDDFVREYKEVVKK